MKKKKILKRKIKTIPSISVQPNCTEEELDEFEVFANPNPLSKDFAERVTKKFLENSDPLDEIDNVSEYYPDEVEFFN